MKAILIARVSTLEQADAGNSLPAQVERMKGYCARKGFEIEEIFSFDESAYKEKRDEFGRIFELVARQKTKIALCFDKVDRLSRNVFDKRIGELYYQALSDQIELHFVSDGQVLSKDAGASEKFHFSITLGLAKYYSDAISDNVKRAFEEKRRNGEWTGPVRIGYKNVMFDAEKRIRKDIVPDPERTHLIKQLFKLYAAGKHSITTLHDEMTKLGLRSRDGKKLSRSNIELILKDPFYMGVARSKKYGDYPHRYEPLISADLFHRCEAIREGRSKNPTKEVAKAYVFKGIVRCDHCGCLMSPEIKKGKFIYYSCTNAKKTCKKVYVPESEMLAPVRDILASFADASASLHQRIVKELKKESQGESLFITQEISRLRAEYDREQRRIERLLDTHLDGTISRDEYTNKLQEMKQKQEDINKQLQEYTTADLQYHVHAAQILSISKRMAEIFDSSEVEEKKQIIAYLLQNPTMDGKKLRYSLKKPFDTVLKIAEHPTVLPG